MTRHAVVFDVDGTLLQSATVDDDLYRQAVHDVLGPIRYRDSLTDYKFVTDAGILTQVIADNDIPWDPALLTSIKKRFLAALESHISAHGPFMEVPGARQHFERLRGSNEHAVAIATGGWRSTATLKLESAEFDIRTVPLASSDDAMDRVDIMLTALSHLGSGFDSVTYYGDGPWDQAAARRLGWRFVAVGPALGGIEDYWSVKP